MPFNAVVASTILPPYARYFCDLQSQCTIAGWCSCIDATASTVLWPHYEMYSTIPVLWPAATAILWPHHEMRSKIAILWPATLFNAVQYLKHCLFDCQIVHSEW